MWVTEASEWVFMHRLSEGEDPLVEDEEFA